MGLLPSAHIAPSFSPLALKLVDTHPAYQLLSDFRGLEVELRQLPLTQELKNDMPRFPDRVKHIPHVLKCYSIEADNEYCGQTQLRFMTEAVGRRLADIKVLRAQTCFKLLREALIGFRGLYVDYGKQELQIFATPLMLNFNRAGQLAVWLHPDPSRSLPPKPPLSDYKDKEHFLILSLLECFEDRVQGEAFPPSFALTMPYRFAEALSAAQRQLVLYER